MSNQLKPGDKVHWTHVNQGKRTLSMRRREGVIEAIEGDIATIKIGSKRYPIETQRLRLDGQKSQITEFVETMVESARGEE